MTLLLLKIKICLQSFTFEIRLFKFERGDNNLVSLGSHFGILEIIMVFVFKMEKN